MISSKTFCWGKVDDQWRSLKRDDEDKFVDGYNKPISPNAVTNFYLKPGMTFRHRHNKAVIKITSSGYILYAQSSREVNYGHLPKWLDRIIFGSYIPMFNVTEYMGNPYATSIIRDGYGEPIGGF